MLLIVLGPQGLLFITFDSRPPLLLQEFFPFNRFLIHFSISSPWNFFFSSIKYLLLLQNFSSFTPNFRIKIQSREPFYNNLRPTAFFIFTPSNIPFLFISYKVILQSPSLSFSFNCLSSVIFGPFISFDTSLSRFAGRHMSQLQCTLSRDFE